LGASKPLNDEAGDPERDDEASGKPHRVIGMGSPTGDQKSFELRRDRAGRMDKGTNHGQTCLRGAGYLAYGDEHLIWIKCYAVYTNQPVTKKEAIAQATAHSQQ
jgi:hypothetical protein